MLSFQVAPEVRWVTIGLASAAALLMLGLVPARAARTTVMYRMEPKPLQAAPGVTRDQIRQALTEMAQRRGWTVYPRTAGVLEADRSISNGKHKATVAIVFDDDDYVIRYVDSDNLGFSDQSCRDPDPEESPFERKTAARRLRDRDRDCDTHIIHPTYNAWVEELEVGADRVIRFLDPPSPDGPLAEAWAMPPDEELRKLEALQAAGVLTAEEAESQRRLIEKSTPEAAATAVPAAQ